MIVVYTTANGQELPQIDKMMPSRTFEASFPAKEGATSAGTSGDGEIHLNEKSVVVKQQV